MTDSAREEAILVIASVKFIGVEPRVPYMMSTCAADYIVRALDEAGFTIIRKPLVTKEVA